MAIPLICYYSYNGFLILGFSLRSALPLLAFRGPGPEDKLYRLFEACRHELNFACVPKFFLKGHFGVFSTKMKTLFSSQKYLSRSHSCILD